MSDVPQARRARPRRRDPRSGVEGRRATRALRSCARPASARAQSSAAAPFGCPAGARGLERRDERRRDPELRVDARVPRGGVLRRGRQQGPLRTARSARSPRSSRSTRTPTSRSSRARSGKAPSRSRSSTSRARRPTRRSSRRPPRCSRTPACRVPRPGRQHQVEEDPRRRRLDPAGRGTPRRLDRDIRPRDRRRRGRPGRVRGGKTKAQILAAVKGTGFIVG